MRAVTLDGKTIEECLHKIKGFVDELASVGVPVRYEEYVDALIEGLPSNYALVVSVIESKKRTPSIAKIEALFYGHETRLTRYNRDAQEMSSALLNYTQGYLHPNAYKTGDSGGSRGLYGRGAFSDRGPILCICLNPCNFSCGLSQASPVFSFSGRSSHNLFIGPP